MILVFLFLGTLAFSQKSEPIFTKGEQSQITGILKGSGISAVFNKTGNLRITPTSQLQNVSVLPNGAFKVSNPSASWALIKAHWVLVAEGAVRDFKSKLGQEKLKQLEKIVVTKN